MYAPQYWTFCREEGITGPFVEAIDGLPSPALYKTGTSSRLEEVDNFNLKATLLEFKAVEFGFENSSAGSGLFAPTLCSCMPETAVSKQIPFLGAHFLSKKFKNRLFQPKVAGL